MAIIATLSPWFREQVFSDNGVVAAGYQIQTFLAGTTTPAVTYTDATSGTPNANPIILDSAGKCSLWLTPGVAVKLIFTTPGDSFPAASPIESVDNVLAVPVSANNIQTPATFGASVTPGTPVYLSDGSGSKTAGQWFVADSTNTYSSSLAPQIGFSISTAGAGGTGNVLIGGQIAGLSGLVAGSTYYIGVSGALTSTPPTNFREIMTADSTITGIVGPNIPPSTNVQTFLATGTWTAPTIMGRVPRTVGVYAWGGGAGGGGGAGINASSTVGQGGSGGGGSALIYRVFNYADIASPVTVTIGAGGTGGAGGIGTSTAHAGANGNPGTASSFGTYLVTSTTPGVGVGGPATAAAIFAGAGSGTAGSGNSTGTGGPPGGGTTAANAPTSPDGGGGCTNTAGGQTAGGYGINGGGSGGNTDDTGVSFGTPGGVSFYGAGGGGGGGGVATNNTAENGGAGGATGSSQIANIAAGGGGGAGGAAGAVGSVGAAGNSLSGGAGGGGGGGQHSSNGGNGGNGGQPGGGGGGGGGINNSAVGGNGGTGGNGAIIVVSYY